jgi:uncharacterized protein YbaP (TraB family)
MDRRRFLLHLAALATVPSRLHAAEANYSRGLLWAVRSGDAPVSHLYGTLHSGDPRVLARVEPLRARIGAARLFMPELVTDAEAVSIYQAASVYDSDDLPRRVGRAKWPRIEKMLALHGVDPRVAVRLRPWAALLTLLQPVAVRQPSLDEALIRLASTQKVAVQPLEQVQEQIDAIALLPEKTHIALLIDASRRHDRLQAAIEPMTVAWLAGDVGELSRINSGLLSEDPALREHARLFMQSLLGARNARFAERLLPEIHVGGVFTAFGASHLAGPDGVLARLVAAGCLIESVT